MTRLRSLCLMAAWAGLAVLLAAGCDVARVQDSPAAARNTPQRDPSGAYSDIRGMPAANVEYFKAKYPPDSWKIRGDNRVVLVGPAVFSQDAIRVLQAAAGSPPAVVGDSSVAMSTDAGTVNFVMVKQYSAETQAVVIQDLTNSRLFQVKSIDDATGLSVYRGQALYSAINESGINHFVECTVAAGESSSADGKVFRVYLRLIDTRSGIVVAATSGAAKVLGEAAKAATVELVKIVSVRM